MKIKKGQQPHKKKAYYFTVVGKIFGLPAAASDVYDVIDYSWQNQGEGVALWRQGHEKWRHKTQSSSKSSSFILKLITTVNYFWFIVLAREKQCKTWHLPKLN